MSRQNGIIFGVTVDAVPPVPFGQILTSWNEWRKAGGLPMRSEFDPLLFWPSVQYLMLLERLPDGDFFYRAVGGHIAAAIGVDATQKRLSELGSNLDIVTLQSTFNAVLDNGLPYYQTMDGRIYNRDWETYERLLLPLSDSDGVARYILGCVVAKSMK